MCSENFVLLSFQLKMVKISYSSFVNFVVIRYREPMRLRNPIPETNTNPPPALWRTCFDKIFEILLKIQILILKTEQKSSIRQKKSTGLKLHWLRYFLIPFSELLIGQDTAPLQSITKKPIQEHENLAGVEVWW